MSPEVFGAVARWRTRTAYVVSQFDVPLGDVWWFIARQQGCAEQRAAFLRSCGMANGGQPVSLHLLRKSGGNVCVYDFAKDEKCTGRWSRACVRGSNVSGTAQIAKPRKERKS